MLTYNRNLTRLGQRHASMASSVSARTIIAAALAASLPAGAAYADNECGSGTTVTCDSGPYTSGITYTGVTNLELSVVDNTSVTDGVNITPSGSGSGTIDVKVDTGTGTITSPASTGLIDSQYRTAVQVDLSGTSYGGKVSAELDSGTLKSTGYQTGGVYIGTYTSAPSADYEFDMSGGTIDFGGELSVGALLNNTSSGSSTIKMTGGTITGNAGIGASKQAGLWAVSFQKAATVTVSGGSITINADNSAAAYALAGGSSAATVNVSDMSISTTGDALATGADGRDGTGSAVVAMNDGSGNASVTMQSGNVTTSGDYANALQSIIAPVDSTVTSTSTVNLQGGTVTTTGASAAGVYAYGDSAGQAYADIDGGTVTTEGDGSHAVMVRMAGSDQAHIDMSAGTVTTKGDNAYGLYAQIRAGDNTNKANIYFHGGSVTTGDSGDPTKGTGSHAVYATTNNAAGSQAYAFVSKENIPLTINTYGANAYGILAEATLSGGTAYAGFQGGTIATEGAGSMGMAATAVDSDVTTNYYQGTLTTLGDGAHGVYATTGGAGNISMLLQNDGSASGQELSTSGDGAHGGYAYSNGSGSIDLWVSAGTFKNERGWFLRRGRPARQCEQYVGYHSHGECGRHHHR
ncbi:hypothetical protein [uncultured Martelella sp.]|uniref:beta strand repeat-containing protein n=1 Tax=uncultured Martelella sp. TaxID=392331 RepID=UPI0029C81BA2|nr:hypothetical protein [uncultured Martelella sp.]